MLLFGRETPTDEMVTFQIDRLVNLAADLERLRRGVPPEVMAVAQPQFSTDGLLANGPFPVWPGYRPDIRGLLAKVGS
ncbi:hypothetical protein [Mesorhizobium sp. INR15]|uniref:hypothetical protein n=1 Tax=Mesorhizobium sp. INR15 TaxID=2654248 RepID=UPI0018965CE5|nr:hypothetical protein [Mesorhizobium sp. INR15]QPC91609.1 hypothetical protein GA829_13935 [Mesorhizobium sp. INR15]